MKIDRFTDLKVWKAAHQLTLQVYRIMRGLPADERFELVAQARRAAVSIPANIAEGFGRRKAADKCRFYNIAHASGEELWYYFILSRDLGDVKEADVPWALLDEVQKMLAGLVRNVLEACPAP
jgi:four helix bundle protein